MLNFTKNTYYVKADKIKTVIELLKDSNYYCINHVTDIPKINNQYHSYDRLETVLKQLNESGNKQTIYLDNRYGNTAKYISREQSTDIYTNQLSCVNSVKSLLDELIKEKPLIELS